MKTLSFPLSLPKLLLASSVVLLAGCGGAVTGLPDSVIVPTSNGAPLSGMVMGGHAPVVGAHVYVMQAGTGGSFTSIPAANNIMGSGSAGTDTHGKYVVTQADGSFNITGDYTCTPGSGKPGLPVYLVAFGGSPYVAQPVTGNANPIKITQGTGSGPGNNGSGFNVTFVGYNLLYVGEYVQFANLTGTGWTSLNSATLQVVAATPTGFTVYSPNYGPAGPVTESGATATPSPAPPTPNPAIANVAVLGNCPTTGNFSATGPGSNVISYVYMNEVSSTAAAYALAGYASGPFNVGIPSGSDALEVAGIQNAANNAAQLYSIQGYYNSSVYAGEGHVANPMTPVGGGTVAQTTLDTLGNIIASCVDSPNTSTSTSTTCSSLFNQATSSGGPSSMTGSGTVPSDTFTAAVNIAHYPAGNPAGNSSKWIHALYLLQSAETTPFSPYLTSQPTDFTVGIKFPVSGAPESVAVDASGNYWYSSQLSAAAQGPNVPCVNGSTCGTSVFVESSPLAAPLYNHSNTNFVYGDVTVDSSNNAWTGNLTGYEDSTEVIPGTTYATDVVSQTFTYAAGPVADSSGDVFFVHGPTAGYPQTGDNIELTEINASRNTANSQPYIASSFSVVNGLSTSYYDVRHGAIDQFGYLWLVSENGSIISRISTGTTTGLPATGFPIGNPNYPTVPCTTGINTPEVPAIDSSGNAWVPINGGGSGTTILKVTPTGVCSSFTTDNGPYGAAVDGSNNVWITDYTANDITEINASTGAINQTYYTVGGFLNKPSGIAVDESGDLLITNYGGSSIVEVIGAATPAYAPLGAASAAGKLGSTP